MPFFTRRSFLKLPCAVAATASGAGIAAVAGVRALSVEMGGDPHHGERLARMKSFSNWRDGKFFNEPGGDGRTVTAESRWSKARRAFSSRDPAVKPSFEIPHEKTDLSHLANGDMVWLGHSGFVLRVAGLTIAVDPALTAACPVPGFFVPFAGADVYQAADLPAVDILLITHDHYDHLDYAVMREIKSRVRHVICPLGVGAHFEAWGFDPQRITETVWWEEIVAAPGLRITCLPSQHFAGRTMSINTTLWAGFLLDIEGYRIYLSGDSGWGLHYKKIADSFGPIDLALLEDGQYNKDWGDIHMLPAAWKRALRDLSPKAVMPCHNSKYALARHAWNDPLINAKASADALGVPLVTPLIGARIPLSDPTAAARIWWS